MQKFTVHQGNSIPLNLPNVDTDMIIPKQFLKTIKRSGLGEGLFYELRYDTDGKEISDFVLNQEQYSGGSVLIAGDNFGCGSSREHAPWALLDYGIRVVVSTSFADIFYNNCFKNGILPIILPQEDVDKLMQDAGQAGLMIVDLEKQKITRPSGETLAFDMDPFRKHCLLNGLDDVAQTLEKLPEIEHFEDGIKSSRSWVTFS